ncbi:MAG: hypothetical protein H6581_29465 [Bacteroidia bacterium]|nr:hypothetical protein [Bacteroidia bacterium]
MIRANVDGSETITCYLNGEPAKLNGDYDWACYDDYRPANRYPALTDFIP